MDKLMTLNANLQDIAHLQEIEGNPLDADQIAMLERFEREGWSEEEQLAHLHARVAAAKAAAAE